MEAIPLVGCALLLITAGCSGFLLTKNVCYGDLGCFGTGAPFFSTHRPINLVPDTPDNIATKFLLYTRNNPTMDKEENIGSVNGTLLASNFYDGSKLTTVIIHGFTDDAHKQWVQTMITELLKKDDINIIAVDWGKGAGIPYTQATANTRLVGAILAKFLTTLGSSQGTTVDKIHIIGHSLGAHTAGYTGQRLRHIARITGLDPAGPYFDGTDNAVSLDATDADFVDVIHTDSSSLLELGLGAQSPMGHVDFFPNGGHHQPGCTSGLWSKGTGAIWNELTLGTYAAKGAVACSHLRSIDLFTESINSPCMFKSYPCTGEQDFAKGKCLHCPHGHCSHMGYDADKYQGRGSLYLDTQAASPYCSVWVEEAGVRGENHRAATSTCQLPNVIAHAVNSAGRVRVVHVHLGVQYVPENNVIVPSVGKTYHYQVNVTESSNVDGTYKIVLIGSKDRTTARPLMNDVTAIPKNIIYSHLLLTPKDIGTLQSATLQYDETSSLLTSWLYPDTLNMLSLSAFCGETGNFTRFCAMGKTVTSHSTVNVPVC